MNISLRFKTIAFILILVSMLIFSVSFLLSGFNSSKTIVSGQVDRFSEVLLRGFEERLGNYLDNVEDNLQTIRSNTRLVETFRRGSSSDFKQTLENWENEYGRVKYDFLSVSFFKSQTCFIYKGYLTNLDNLSCTDVMSDTSSVINYRWHIIEQDRSVLAVYSTPLVQKSSGRVIGRLMAGVNLKHNNYLIERLITGNKSNLKSFDFIYNNQEISSLTVPRSQVTGWYEQHIDLNGNNAVLSKGNTALGQQLLIKIRSNDDALQSLKDQLTQSFLSALLIALVVAVVIALFLSRAVDNQLQSLIFFARRANAGVKARWDKTNISEFNDIGEEIAAIVKDLQDQKDLLKTTNDELSQANSSKREILHNLMHTQENERIRLSNELHDGMGKLLANVRVNLFMLRDELDEQEIPSITANKCIAITDSIYDSVYERISYLRPFEMDDYGLSGSLPKIPALTQLEELDYSVFIDIKQDRLLSEKTMSNLYRIAQEALSNTIKHANGSYVSVKLRDEEDGVRLIIEDDGVGLSRSENSSAAGFGLMNMRERADYINAVIKIGPGICDEGVIIDVFVPSEHAYQQQRPLIEDEQGQMID